MPRNNQDIPKIGDDVDISLPLEGFNELSDLKRKFVYARTVMQLNKTDAAKAAGFNCSDDRGFSTNGWRVEQEVRPLIMRWYDEMGLSEDAIKLKIAELMDAEDVRTFPVKASDADGSETLKIVEHRVPDNTTRFNSVKLAAQIRGMLVNTAKVEVTHSIASAILKEIDGASADLPSARS